MEAPKDAPDYYRLRAIAAELIAEGKYDRAEEMLELAAAVKEDIFEIQTQQES